MNHTSAVLLAKDISVQFTTEKGYVQAVKHISIEVHQGKITALIGQSGSGKSATAMAIAGILDSNGTMTSGEIYLQNQDISKLKGKALRAYRGKHLGMVFQEPMESLNPLLKIEEQIYQTLRLTQKLNKKQAKQKAIALLEQVGLPEPEKILKKYPFELSGRYVPARYDSHCYLLESIFVNCRRTYHCFRCNRTVPNFAADTIYV